MCGIAGIHHTQAIAGRHDVVLVHSALDRLAHLGPDDDGSYQAGGTVLRAIVASASSTPLMPGISRSPMRTDAIPSFSMARCSTTGSCVLAGSGRSHLPVAHRTRRCCSAFRAEGPDFLHDLNGFFALAIHDRETGELFLARDRFGIKPLLWAHHEQRSGSPANWVPWRFWGALPDVDRASLAQYLTFHHVPAPIPSRTGARRLLPGHRMTVGPKGISIERWYDLASVGPYTGTRPGLRPEGPAQDAVRLRLDRGRSGGCYLSGGLDSSIISALPHGPIRSRTFSIGYTEDPLA